MTLETTQRNRPVDLNANVCIVAFLIRNSGGKGGLDKF